LTILATVLAPNVLTSQDLVNHVMAYSSLVLQFANSGLENLLLDFVARYHLFRAFVLGGLEFNETQVFALFPSSVGFLSHVST
jgi:hypothetical protein